MSRMQWIDQSVRYLFFTGKGGVGKTSLSCATALALADQGRRTLLVSTDPASNLDQVLSAGIGAEPTPIAGADGLWALNIDPRQSAAAYRERVVGPYRGVLPEAAVKQMEEQLSGACTVEIAAFDEFSRLLTDEATAAAFDHIVFDTAPTGHTLRLLQLPAAWQGYLESNSGGASCLGPMSGLQGQQAQFADTVANLTDAALTRLVLVARPDQPSLLEAARTSLELARLGVASQHLVVNGVLVGEAGDDATATAMMRRQANSLANLPAELQGLNRSEVSLSPVALLGLPALRALLAPGTKALANGAALLPGEASPGLGDLTALIDELGTGPGVVMTMGKGGVGKTSLASRVAVELARHGARVHLTTTDPAAHLDASLADHQDRLQVSRIDPVVETEQYRAEVMAKTGAQLDEAGRQLLAEDLLSPCTEETAVFRAFARVVGEATDRVVVIDTAPTGHTILLLDATEAYHREVSRNQSALPDDVQLLLPRLRDPAFTRVLIVTLPEATPVQEAADLQDDLKRAGISPYAWVINQSLSPLAVSHPVLRAKRAGEAPHLLRVQELAQRVALEPWREANGHE